MPTSASFQADELVAGRYRVISFLAAGGMGEVYLARDQLLGEDVALKVLAPALAADERARERFLREIQLARKVSHRNVCRIHDVGVDAVQQRLFLTMELLHGETLGRRLRDGGRIPPAEALPLIAELAAGLDAAHAAGVIHRDFKGDNVILARGPERAVITDFGVARPIDMYGPGLTGVGDLVGTPGYMAPEQLAGQATVASDVYAFGVVIYEMVTGARPYPPDPIALLRRLRDGEQPIPPRTHAPDLDERWQAVILRCLAMDPGERFARAGQVAEALAGTGAPPVDEALAATSPGRAPPAAPAGSPLVGRERELAQLGALAPGGLFLLVGEPGIGKTRLASEAARRAAGRGLQVVWGRAWEGGGAPVYWPWIQILRELIRDRGPQLVGSSAGDLAHVLPELRPDGDRAPALDPAAARFRLFDAVVGLLRRAAAERPLLLLLDDVHAADRSSLLLLHFLARELRTLRVAVVCTYRDVEARLSQEVGPTLALIAREGVTLRLGPLDRAQASQLLLSTSATSPGDEVVEAVCRAAEGNPLFLEQLGQLVGARRRLPGTLPIPDSVQEVIRQRLELLGPTARAVLEAASIAGGELDAERLAPLAGLGLDETDEALAEATARGALVETAPGRHAFAHALVREVVHRGLDRARRRELHRAAAESLRGDPQALAVHLLEAGEVERGARAAIAAAEGMLGALAYEDAVSLLERAQAVAATAAERLRCELLIALGSARLQAGRQEAGLEACRRAGQLAESLADADLLARAALAYGSEVRVAVVDPVLIGMLERALASLPPGDSALRARLSARLAAAQQPAPDIWGPIALARDAIRMARRLGDPRTLLEVIHSAMSAMVDFVDAEESAPLNHEAAQLARSFADRPRELRAHARLVFDYLQLGETARADQEIDVYQRLADTLRLPHLQWLGMMYRAMRAVMSGRFAEADELTAATRALGERAKIAEVPRCLAMHRIGRMRAENRIGDVGALDAEMDAVFGNEPYTHLYKAVLSGACLVQAGRLDEARERLLPLFRLRSDSPLREFSFLFPFLAEVSAALGELETARFVYDALLPHRAHFFAWGRWGMICEPPIAFQVGLLARALGRPDEAVGHLEYALRATEAAGMHPHAARIAAEVAAARGG